MMSTARLQCSQTLCYNKKVSRSMHFIILGELGYKLDKDFVTLNPITQLRVHFLLLKLCPVVNYLSQRDDALFFLNVLIKDFLHL